MATILDGKRTAASIRQEVGEAVGELVAAGGRPPGLAAVLVGEDPASQIYVASKGRACREIGIRSWEVQLSADLSQAELLATIDELNANDEVDGILVQLPLPQHLDERLVIDRIDPSKDVDGFHPMSVGRLWLGEPAFRSATPAGVMELLRRYEVDLVGMNAVIVGRSNIVGKPMAALLIAAHCTVTICHSRTRDLPRVCRGADLLVAAIGRPAFIGPDHVAEGAVVVDVGINRLTDLDSARELLADDDPKLITLSEKGRALVGDVDYHRVKDRCRAITPVPGGVGPLTIAALLSNTLEAARQRQGRS